MTLNKYFNDFTIQIRQKKTSFICILIYIIIVIVNSLSPIYKLDCKVFYKFDFT